MPAGDTLRLICEAFEGAGIGLLVVDAGRVTHANGLAAEWLGVGAPALEGRALLDALAEPTGLATWRLELWLARARKGPTLLRPAERAQWAGGRNFEARYLSPLVRELPSSDALVLRQPSRPHQARVAHDLANLMQGVSVGLSVLSLRADTGEGGLDTDAVGELSLLSSRAAALARRLSAPPRQGSAHDVAGRVEQTARAILGDRLHWEASVAVPSLALSGDEWETVILSLLFNAREAAPGESPIHVLQQAESGVFVLRVADRGRGMDPETLRRCQEPGFSTKAAGPGMGLTTVAGIVARAHGALSIESSEGVGTTVWIELPILPEE
ncbi:MAG: ATP-binding protein [Sandaracinaceae bacterium]|nr:ATP-binding protein [Sandaracinaceae bacterium]